MTRDQLLNGAQPENFRCPLSPEKKQYCGYAVVQGSRLVCSKVDCALAVPELGWSQGFCFMVATRECLAGIRDAIKSGEIEKDEQGWKVTTSDQRNVQTLQKVRYGL